MHVQAVGLTHMHDPHAIALTRSVMVQNNCENRFMHAIHFSQPTHFSQPMKCMHNQRTSIVSTILSQVIVLHSTTNNSNVQTTAMHQHFEHLDAIQGKLPMYVKVKSLGVYISSTHGQTVY